MNRYRYDYLRIIDVQSCRQLYKDDENMLYAKWDTATIQNGKHYQTSTIRQCTQLLSTLEIHKKLQHTTEYKT